MPPDGAKNILANQMFELVGTSIYSFQYNLQDCDSNYKFQNAVHALSILRLNQLSVSHIKDKELCYLFKIWLNYNDFVIFAHMLSATCKLI